MPYSQREWERMTQESQDRAEQRRQEPRPWWRPYAVIAFVLATWFLILVAAELVARIAP